MVEDPYTVQGRSQAANALSDIYAMGGTVKTALNIVWLSGKLRSEYSGESCVEEMKKYRKPEVCWQADIRLWIRILSTDCP